MVEQSRPAAERDVARRALGVRDVAAAAVWCRLHGVCAAADACRAEGGCPPDAGCRAAGRSRTTEVLDGLTARWTVLHDRLVRPGRSDAVADHVVIGPGGAFLVDSRNTAGRGTGWLAGPVQRLSPVGRRESEDLAREMIRAAGIAVAMSVRSGRDIWPVLSLSGVFEDRLDMPRQIRGVWVVPAGRLVDWLDRRPPVLTSADIGRVATRAMSHFPPLETDPELLAAIGAADARAAGLR